MALSQETCFKASYRKSISKRYCRKLSVYNKHRGQINRINTWSYICNW